VASIGLEEIFVGKGVITGEEVDSIIECSGTDSVRGRGIALVIGCP